MEFALPPKQLLEFMVQSVNANQLYLVEHVPDVFDGDMVIFSARSGNENDSSHLQNWRPYVAGDITVHSVHCAHDEMMTTESLSMYGEQLKLSLEASAARNRCLSDSVANRSSVLAQVAHILAARSLRPDGRGRCRALTPHADDSLVDLASQAELSQRARSQLTQSGLCVLGARLVGARR